MQAEDLIGTWRLKTWKNTGSDGSSVDPLGEAPIAPPANLDGDLLTLSTKPMTFQGVERSAHLVWERVGRD